MKLRGRVNRNNTIRLKIHDTFNVILRPLPRHTVQALLKESTTKERGPNGKLIDTLDSLAFARARLREMFAGIEGLTPDIFLDLTQLPDDVEVDLPEPDENGFIPATDATVWKDPDGQPYNLLEFLWDKAATHRFSQVIEAAIEEYEVLLHAQREKKDVT